MELTLLFDADMLLFESCSSVEEPIDWGDDLWTLHADAGLAKMKVDSKVQNIVEKVLQLMKYTGQYKIVMCLSDKENFRKKLFTTYKANRVGKRKPVCYYGVKKWLEESYETCCYPTLEADDVVGILSTTLENTVSVSGDKDFKTIPGWFYDYQKNELHHCTLAAADRWHLYQTLVGDTADNYPGCPGYGKVTATKLLDKNPTWEGVVEAFESKGLTEEDALLQARIAHILRKGDYDLKTQNVTLWSPEIIVTQREGKSVTSE